MNGHDNPELFDPIETFDLQNDLAYLKFSARVAAESDVSESVSFADGIARLGDASHAELQAYIETYHAAALRKVAVEVSGLPYYSLDFDEL